MDMQSLESSMKAVSLGVEAWQGSTVFVTATSQRCHSPRTPPPPSQQRSSGTAASPISVTSSPSSSPAESPDRLNLPRPRAIPSYTSPLPRTAYTPPRSRTLPFTSDSPSYAGPSAARIDASTSDRPVHPFFARTFVRSRSSPVPPSPHKPRFVADYSSTSESQSSSQQTQTGESTFGSQESPARNALAGPSRGTDRIQGVTPNRGSPGSVPKRPALRDTELDEITSMIGNVDLTGKFKENPLSRRSRTVAAAATAGQVGPRHSPSPTRLPQYKAAAPRSHPVRPASPLAPARTLPTAKLAASTVQAKASKPSKSTSAAFAAATTFLPESSFVPVDPATLPFFSYRKFPNPPKVAYTTDPDEANDLLSCLKGPVLGLDLEWPMAGMYDKVDPKTGRTSKVRVGMTWDPATKRYKFGQGKVALVQLCDDRLIVLVHLMDMTNLPNKVVEIMTDPKIFKTGVQVRGDGIKLVRDFPAAFPNGLTNLLEINNVARRVDPISMGPGSRLVSLANLTERYLSHRLDKDADVRKSNWHMVLSGQQREYAANDVYAGLQLHRALVKVGQENNVQFGHDDLRRCSNDIDSQGQAMPGVATTSSSPQRPVSPTNRSAVAAFASGSDDDMSRFIRDVISTSTQPWKPPSPAQLAAYNNFRSGKSIDAIAKDRNIRLGTARDYVLSAIITLRAGATVLRQRGTDGETLRGVEMEGMGISLTTVDKERLCTALSGAAYMTTSHRRLLKSIRAEIRAAHGGNEAESGSEVEEEKAVSRV